LIVLIEIYGDQISATLPGVLGVSADVTPIISSIVSARNQIDSIATGLENEITNAKTEDIDNNEELQALKNKKMEIKARNVAIEGMSLRETISQKFDANEYVNNLGIVHKVHQDLQSISDSMLNNKRRKDIFPRGDPRIILFVDDLDRCPQDTVVEVIEALQLVVKTKLFVAVLAIDPRYVCLALEKKYKGILHPKTPPTGMDFLEKIIQIPFRLPGVEDIGDFLRDQIEVGEPQDDSKPVETGDSSIVKTSSSAVRTPNEPESNKSSAKVEVKKLNPGNEDLPSNMILFDEEEGIMMEEILGLFGVGPRCLRRIIDVFKVLKVVWKRDRRLKVDINLKKASLFLMLLASDESTREVTHNIFEWMELGMMKYHLVSPPDIKGTHQDENNLANLFETELRKHSSEDFELFFYKDQKPKQGTLMAFVKKYLDGYKWTCLKEWKEISFKFMLVRSFSFFRLVTEEIDMKSLLLDSMVN